MLFFGGVILGMIAGCCAGFLSFAIVAVNQTEATTEEKMNRAKERHDKTDNYKF